MKPATIYVAILSIIVVVQFVVHNFGRGKSDVAEKLPLEVSVDRNDCSDPAWCNIQMPSRSFFRFPPPTDVAKWKRAQQVASSGEHVLLQRSLATFPNHLDFIDGNNEMKQYNPIVDIFVDQESNFNFLKTKLNGPLRRRLEEEGTNKRVFPEVRFNLNVDKRAPIIKLGLFTFYRKEEFISPWKQVKDEIQTPHIFMHHSNENWGMFSTYLPNRTADWGPCCESQDDRKYIPEILDHPKTIMFLTNQHHNISHPKLITIPRGLPIFQDRRNIMLWDLMRNLVTTTKKERLVFTSSSNFGARPQILKCIANKFNNPDEFYDKVFGPNQAGRLSESEYYKKLAVSRLSIALPGIGYDTFRLWEAMVLGTLPVVERGVGLDKMLWRLPALIVDDYDTVTPELLRTAYVEAIYRADEFEYERLKMSWWLTFITNVSLSMKTETIFEKFPLEADEPYFRRPFVPFECAKTDTCGSGTIKTAKSFC